MLQLSSIAPLLDRFMPNPDLQIRHKIVVRAPAALILETARTFDLRSTPLVRAIFWLRARILDAKAVALTATSRPHAEKRRCQTMLRITVEEQENLTTLRLEGKLKGDWVPELERCWMRTRSADPNRHLMIDLP